jgi:hypothetical protein
MQVNAAADPYCGNSKGCEVLRSVLYGRQELIHKSRSLSTTIVLTQGLEGTSVL